MNFTKPARCSAVLIVLGCLTWIRADDAAPKPVIVKPQTLVKMDEARFQDAVARWEKSMPGRLKIRTCDTALGEEIAWKMAGTLDSLYYGYKASKNPQWVAALVDWADSWIKRGVKEQDGYIGWPVLGAASTTIDDLEALDTDCLLGEASALRPIVLMAGEILKNPALKEKYGAKAQSYLELSRQIFEKWVKRGGWRDTPGGGAMVVLMPYAIDRKTGKWTADSRFNVPGAGASCPNNKVNFTSHWLLAMYDVTGAPIYREAAEKWFKLMKSRMHPRDDGTFYIWNYWEPAGPWDYKPDGAPKHWVGIHRNPGYYNIDVEAIVDAHEHGLVFTAADIDRLIATSKAEKRFWKALVPYSPEMQQTFESGKGGGGKGGGGFGGGLAPAYLARQAELRERSR